MLQQIHPNLYNYVENTVTLETEGEIKHRSIISFDYDGDFELKLEGKDGSLTISHKGEVIVLDTNNSNNLHEALLTSKYSYEKGNITIALDNSSIEVFINDGVETISSRYYILGETFTCKFNNI